MWLDEFAQTQVYLFIAPGFDEDFVVGCVVQMRRRGVGVALIGPTRGEMIGALGVAIRPDLSLDHTEKFRIPQMLIIPGGQDALNRLIIEPRLHRLVKTALQIGKVIVLGKGVENFLSYQEVSIYAKSQKQIIYQEGMETGPFIQQLTQWCTKHPIPATSQALQGQTSPEIGEPPP